MNTKQLKFETLECFKSRLIKERGIKEDTYTTGVWKCIWKICHDKTESKPTQHELHIKKITTDEYLQNIYKKYIPEHDFFIFENSRPSTNTCITNYDGVLYAINSTSGLMNLNKPEIPLVDRMKDRAVNFNIIKKHHHDTIKKVYNYCLNLNLKNLWCKIEHGNKVTFGNDRGNVLIMILPHENSNLKYRMFFQDTVDKNTLDNISNIYNTKISLFNN
jgi:hypothetical protein